MGIEVTITQSQNAKLIGEDNRGICLFKTGKTNSYASLIKNKLFENGSESDEAKNMLVQKRLLYRIPIGCLIPREGSTDQIPKDCKHFILFLVNKHEINLPAYICNHLCESIRERKKHQKKNVPYARLLFELFH